MFDPWTATFEEAMAEQERWQEAGGAISSPLGPIAQANGAYEILAAKERIDAGDGFAVLYAIRVLVTNGLVAPEWLAFAFNRRYDAVNWFRAGSWDDSLAFGRPYPKGTNLAARRKARIGRFSVWNAAVAKIDSSPDTPIDKSFFEEIGKPLGFGATLAEELYRQAKKMHGYCPKKSRHRRVKQSRKV